MPFGTTESLWGWETLVHHGFMPISTRDLSEMPDIDSLQRLTQSIAMLDAIISPEWDHRYFSFNTKWDQSRDERMASMRNGSGDEYFVLFTPQGAILKGFDHESPMSPWTREPVEVWPGVLDHVPEEFAHFLTEPAFNMQDASFCVWRTHRDDGWRRGPVASPSDGDPDGSENLMWMLDRRPETYAQFALDYFERTLSVALIRTVYEWNPLTPAIASEINPDVIWGDVLRDAEEIGYPTTENA